MAQFYRTGVISGNSFGLQIAAGMNDNIVTSATGESSPVLLNSPNADQTNSLRSTRSLANLLAACVKRSRRHGELFRSDHASQAASRHTILPKRWQTSLAIRGENVDGIFALTLLSDLYAPPLVTMPDAWTVTVKVNDSGSDEPDRLIGGPGNLAFDKRGYAWVTNNTVQGTPDSSRFDLVFKPNGQPADGRNGTPRSPFTGGGILGTGFGVTIDPRGSVWFGNFGWGDVRRLRSIAGWKWKHFTLHVIGRGDVAAEWISGRSCESARNGLRSPTGISGSRASTTTAFMCSYAVIRINP